MLKLNNINTRPVLFALIPTHFHGLCVLQHLHTIPFETLLSLNLGGPHSCLPQLHEGTSTVPTPKQPHWSHRGLRQEGTI